MILATVCLIAQAFFINPFNWGGPINPGPAWAESQAWDQLTLSDAQRFNVDKDVALGNYRWARDHKNTVRPEMELNNTADVYYEWEKEADWRRKAWDLLDNVLNPLYGFTPEGRLQELYRLRYHIGQEAFLAGIMPVAIPTYRRYDQWSYYK